jgi:hypothetical protein
MTSPYETVVITRDDAGVLVAIDAPTMAIFSYDLVFASEHIDLEIDQLRIRGTDLVYKPVRWDDDARRVVAVRLPQMRAAS